MVWYFISVYIINRILHGRLEIRNFSSHVENISLVCCAHSWNIFQHSKRNFLSPRDHVISSISLLAFRCCYCYHLNPARKQRPTAPKLDYDTWTPPRQVSGVGAGAGVRHRKPTNSVQAMLEKNGEHVTIQYNTIQFHKFINVSQIVIFNVSLQSPEENLITVLLKKLIKIIKMN